MEYKIVQYGKEEGDEEKTYLFKSDSSKPSGWDYIGYVDTWENPVEKLKKYIQKEKPWIIKKEEIIEL